MIVNDLREEKPVGKCRVCKQAITTRQSYQKDNTGARHDVCIVRPGDGQTRPEWLAGVVEWRRRGE